MTLEAMHIANIPGQASPSDLEPIIDAIYEAAFIPDGWSRVLDRICAVSEFVSGEFQSLDGVAPPRWRATDMTHDILEKFIADGLWKTCPHSASLVAKGYPGFLCSADVLTPDEWDRDPVRRALEPRGVSWMTSTLIPLPTGELAGFSFGRRLESGRPAPKNLAALDALRPHLARAGLIATRLRLERAQNTVMTLEAIGLAAAVLNTTDRVLAVNALLEGLSSIFLPLAHGRLGLADAKAQMLFDDALEQARRKQVTSVRSIPVARRDGQLPLILHILPLVREAYAVFSGGDVLVVATELKGGAMVPSPKLLHALFDLSPSEARLAGALAQGLPLKQVAADMGVTFSTARTYVERVLHKTGTHQQSQLVALLKSVPVLGGQG